ncbi:MAG: peroxide stress protein YaaA [Sediminicola sp.]|tara:strand:+ start:120559 stop:121320 length:762 start_codon:yes stop_codon:yes gene_type:complete
MKIVISPAKSLDYDSKMPQHTATRPHFLEDAVAINKALAKKKPKDLSKLMDISDKLAQLNWERNQNFEVPFDNGNARPAIFAFSGDVYQGLDAYSISPKKMEILQEKLRILSGQYGLLRPLDLIQPYRLEMGTSLKIGRKKNLYEFWRKKLTDRLNTELADGEALVNLASNEYFGALDEKALKAPVITPIFKDWKGDKLKVISFFAKKARGSMVRFIIDNGVGDLEGIKSFNVDGYAYSGEFTEKGHQPVFVR